jgi:hypothetical protein
MQMRSELPGEVMGALLASASLPVREVRLSENNPARSFQKKGRAQSAASAPVELKRGEHHQHTREN